MAGDGFDTAAGAAKIGTVPRTTLDYWTAGTAMRYVALWSSTGSSR